MSLYLNSPHSRRECEQNKLSLVTKKKLKTKENIKTIHIKGETNIVSIELKKQNQH